MRVWGRGDGHCSDITHWNHSSVYCTCFLPTPWGDFSQQHWDGVKSIIAKVCTGKLISPDISSCCPQRLALELLFYKFCMWFSVFCDSLWFSWYHWREGVLAESGPWCTLSLFLMFWQWQGERGNLPPFFQLWRSMWLQKRIPFPVC